MYVSQETPAQTDARLREVIALSELVVYDESYAFVEEDRTVGQAPAIHSQALALVADEHVWSQLVPSDDEGAERFGLFSFHFPDGVDNSGFVGWLATLLKRELGTGVFVVCGQNSSRGGIFDYWGCPWAERERVVDVVRELVG